MNTIQTTTVTHNGYTISLKRGDVCFWDENKGNSATGDRLVITDEEKKNAVHMEFSDKGFLRYVSGKSVEELTEKEKAHIQQAKEIVEQCEDFQGTLAAVYVHNAAAQAGLRNNG